MNENEISQFEGRTYLSPTVSQGEQEDFISTLRETMAGNTAQINADTYALGNQLPSNLGGLSGAEETFTARYQTPQLNQTAADLRTAAQQTALNQALTNLQNAWKKRYNDAILAYQRRAATPSTSGDGAKGETEFQGQDLAGKLVPSTTGGYPGTSTVLMPNLRQGIYAMDSNGKVGNFLGYADDITTYGKVTGDPVVEMITDVASTMPQLSAPQRSERARVNATNLAWGGTAGRVTGMGGKR